MGEYDAAHDELRCTTPAGAAGPAVVRISLNGEQFTTAVPTFEYLPNASISHLVPAGGPRQGGTSVVVHGAGFGGGADVRCRFGGGGQAAVVAATLMDGSRLRCLTPAARCGPGSCWESVEVSLNSESFDESSVPFAYHNASVSSLSAAGGPAGGGTVVTVYGAGFVDLPRVEAE